MTDPIGGGEAERRLMRHERGENEIEGRETQRSMSESNQRDEMEKVGGTEMIQYPPPRVAEEAKKFGLRVGTAMDLTIEWDLRRSDPRHNAWEC